MFDSPRRSRFAVGVAVALATALAGCTEDYGTGAACPDLCPTTDVEMREIVLDAIALDTTLVGLPPLGSPGRLLVATRGDTLVTYGVIRYDVVPTRFRPSASDTTTAPIGNVVGAEMRILTDTARRIVTAPVTINLYDVDTTAADSSNAAIAALIRPDRLIGSVTLPQDTTLDTLRVPIDDAVLLSKIQSESRLRVGIQVTSAQSAQFVVIGLASTTDATHITFTPIGEDNVEGAAITIQPRSTTPAESRDAAAQLADYTVVAVGSPDPPPDILAVGGMPSRRAYLRFDLPPEILDSATIVRAQLILTQQPVTGGVLPNDTIGVFPYIVTAGAPVTDVWRAASLIAAGSLLGLDSIKVVPSGSAVRTLEVVPLLRAWQRQDPERVPHALVLRTNIEGYEAREVRFHSSEAADPALRPRLRLIYIPRTNQGLP